jgi:hypothetical protein
MSSNASWMYSLRFLVMRGFTVGKNFAIDYKLNFACAHIKEECICQSKS